MDLLRFGTKTLPTISTETLPKAYQLGGTGFSWNPGYTSNPPTNQYTLAGTSYDSDGNLLNDSMQSYTWSSYNLPASIGSKTFVYDALGRVAESTSGTTVLQYIYSPIGLLGTMNGQLANIIRWPLPGGATFQDGGNKLLVHKDWLGSKRLLTDR